MAQLRRALAGYEERRARCFAVTTGTPEHTREFCAAHEVPFTCLVDYPGEPAYAAFGQHPADHPADERIWACLDALGA